MTTEQRTITEYYCMGFITYKEYVQQMTETGTPEGQIIADELQAIKNSDEYFELRIEFEAKVSSLIKQNDKIDAILSYMQLMATNTNKNDSCEE